jgi:Domain of unknown function (DUF4837)
MISLSSTRRIPIGLSLLVGTIILQGCSQLEYKPEAIGRVGEIVVVIDSARWSGPIGDAIKDNLAPWLGTLPAPEQEFSLKRMSITSEEAFKTIRKHKNLVFVAPLSDSTAEANFLRSRLDPDVLEMIMGGRSAVVGRPNLWRKDQLLYYVMAPTVELAAAAIEENAEGIRFAFNRITRQRVTKEMFKKGRQVDIETSLMEKHGFAVNAQHDYFVAIDTTNFVWLRRVVSSDSWRSFFIYYIEGASPATLTREWIDETRDQLSRTWVRGNVDEFYVSTDYRRELRTENIDFKGRFGFESRGLWHMIAKDADGKTIEYGMGGPFISYAFYDEDTSRIYLMGGMVFAPGYPKREFLRHMESIAYTFRTEADVARQEEEAKAASKSVNRP